MCIILAALGAMKSKIDMSNIATGGYRGYIHFSEFIKVSCGTTGGGRRRGAYAPPNYLGRGGGEGGVWPVRGAGAGGPHALLTLSTH